MTQVMLQKVRGVLVPCDEDSDRFVQAVPEGQGIGFDAKLKRNIRNHRRAFALLRIGFDAWEPPEAEHPVDAVKSFDVFREDILILAGNFERVFVTRFQASARDEKGRFTREPQPIGEATLETKLIAKSISFASLGEDEFREIYTRILAVMWEKVLRWVHYESPEQVDHVVEQLLRFE